MCCKAVVMSSSYLLLISWRSRGFTYFGLGMWILRLLACHLVGDHSTTAFVEDSPIMIHTPWKLTWDLKITQLKRKIVFQTSIFGFHVNFPGHVWWKAKNWYRFKSGFRWNSHGPWPNMGCFFCFRTRELCLLIHDGCHLWHPSSNDNTYSIL